MKRHKIINWVITITVILWVVVILFSCKKQEVKEINNVPPVIYVTAQAVDYDGQITMFPIATVRTN